MTKSLLHRIATALRGGANEAGESVLSGQDLRILDQEIRDADADMNKSNEALANLMAKCKVAEKNVAELNAKIAENEAYVVEAVEQGKEDLGLEVASRIADLEARRDSAQAELSGYQESLTRLRQVIAQSQTTLKQLKQQAESLRATDSVQRAQTAVSGAFTGTKTNLGHAMQSVEAIKKRQTERAALLESSAELTAEADGSSLDKRLEQAGITGTKNSGQSVMARIMAERNVTKRLPNG